MAGVRRGRGGVRRCEGQELLEFLAGLEMSAARSPEDWIGLVFLASSSSAAERRGRAGASAELRMEGRGAHMEILASAAKIQTSRLPGRATSRRCRDVRGPAVRDGA